VRGAVLFVAAAELRRRWKALAALGLLAGLVGAAVLGAAQLARRTATARDRLNAATHVDDVRVLSLGPQGDLYRHLLTIPDIAQSRHFPVGIGRLPGPSVNYIAIQGVDPGPRTPMWPVIIQGRRFHDNAPDEVVVAEEVARTGHIGVGTAVPLQMLTPDQAVSFGAGLGAPAGPSLTVHIVGVARVPSQFDTSAPLYAGPAFFQAHPGAVSGEGMYISLRGGVADYGHFRSAADQVVAALPTTPATEAGRPQFVRSDEGQSAVATTTHTLTFGLVVFVVVAGLVGLVSLAMAFSRHQAATAGDQQVQGVLGMTSTERGLARGAAAVLAALIAAAVTAAAGLALGGLEPLGGIHRYEPHPGWTANIALISSVSVAMAVAVVLVGYVTARRAASVPARTRRTSAVGRVPGWVWLSAGVRFALEAGRRSGRASARASLAAIVVGLAGLVATITFATTRDRLVNSPAAWGWSADFGLLDVTVDKVEALARDARVADATAVLSQTVRINGADLAGYSFQPVKGDVGWTLSKGRLPLRAGELAVGPRVASRFNLGVGSKVTAVDGDNHQHELTVVGIGLGPPMRNDRLGDAVALSQEGMAEIRRIVPDNDALIRVQRGVNSAAYAQEVGQQYELQFPEAPPEVRNLAELGRLPAALGLFLAVIAAVALGHALWATTRRRAPELAILRVLGLTPAQAAASVVAMALVTCVLAAVLAVVFGVATGRVVWTAVSTTTQVGIPASVSPSRLALLGVPLLAGSVIVALLPARRAARLHPAVILRGE
jgi:putative ABC transport system permease protein